MKRVLIFGGDGLLGSHLYLALKDAHEVGLTLHREVPGYPARLFAAAQVFPGVAAGDGVRVSEALDAFRPDWVINAIGLTKRPLARDPYASLEANALFPHLLAGLCAERSIRMLHFSTDGVFSGQTGNYAEQDQPDCLDWYGRCKLLGEPRGSNVLVLRTAFVGLELGCKLNLVEWFLARQGTVPGYRQAIWSGLTAREVGRVADFLITSDSPLNGVWHLASQAISKFDWLTALEVRLRGGARTVVPDDSVVCDRSLNGQAFYVQTGYVAPSWNVMLDELAEDIARRWIPGTPSYWQN